MIEPTDPRASKRMWTMTWLAPISRASLVAPRRSRTSCPRPAICSATTATSAPIPTGRWITKPSPSRVAGPRTRSWIPRISTRSRRSWSTIPWVRRRTISTITRPSTPPWIPTNLYRTLPWPVAPAVRSSRDRSIWMGWEMIRKSRWATPP